MEYCTAASYAYVCRLVGRLLDHNSRATRRRSVAKAAPGRTPSPLVYMHAVGLQ